MVRRAFFLWPTLALLLMLLALLLALVSVDLGMFKPQLLRFAGDALGRELRIDGPLHIAIGRESVVVVEDLRLADAGWTDGDAMLSVGRAELHLDTRSLLRRPITLNSITLVDAELHLQVDDAGRKNWDFGFADSPAAQDDDSAGLELLVRRVLVENTRLVYASPEREGPIRLELQRLEQTHDADDYLQLRGNGKVGERAIALRGRFGTWPALRAQQNIEYELEAQLDTVAIRSRGVIDDLAAPRRPQLAFSVAAPALNDLLQLLQLRADAEGDIQLEGSLSPAAGGPLRIAFSGNLGRTTFAADGSVSALQDPQQIDINLETSGPDLSHVLRLAGIHDIGAAPFKLALDLERDGPVVTLREGQLLFADAQLRLDARLPRFPSPDDAAVELRIEGPDFARLREYLNLPGRAAGAYAAVFDLDVTDKGVEIMRLDVQSELLRATGTGRLGAMPDLIGTQAEFEVDVASIRGIGDTYGVPGLPDRPLRLTGAAALEERGLRTRGPLRLHSGDAQATLDGLIALRPDLAGSELAVHLQAPDLAALVNAFAALPEVPGQSIDLGAQVAIERTTLEVDALTGTLGSTAIDGGGRIGRRSGLAGTRLDLHFAGPAIEELTERIPTLRIRPGPFDLSGTLALEKDRLRLAAVNLDRERSELDLELDLALPLSRREVSFDVRADAADLRAVIGEPGGFVAYKAPFTLEARGLLERERLSIRRLEARLGEASLSAEGDLDMTLSRRSASLHANVDIPSLARIGELGGRRFNDQSLALRATANSGSGVLTVEDLDLRIKNSDLRARMRLEQGDVPRLRLDLQSESLRIAPLREPEPFSFDPEPEFDDGRLIPDIPLPLAALKRLNADISVSIGELQRGALKLSDLTLLSSLEDGALTIEELRFNGASGALRSRASLRPVADSAKLELDLVTRDFAPSLEELDGRVYNRMNLDASLSASGKDLRALAAGANGVIFADARGGRIVENRLLRRLYGNMLNEIIATINPFSKTDDVLSFDCVIAPLEITNGFLKTRPEVYVRTDRVRVHAGVAVNLATEKLALDVRSTPEKTLTLSASELINPYVKIEGSLAAPRLAVDEKGALVASGAAVATGGLSVLAKAAIDRLSRARNPCKAAAEAGIKELGSRFPDLPLAATE